MIESEDFELTLFDRIEVIKTTISQYGVNNFYVAFSGGKDSMVLHTLIDMALPGNKIPRVYSNTGIEYALMLKHVRQLAENDPRIIILNSGVNIRHMLEEKGYPFKSKEHSNKVDQFNRGNYSKFVLKYMRKTDYNPQFVCPKKLMYQFEKQGAYHYSDRCCYYLKKKPMHKWSKENNRPISITGIRMDEGGQRRNKKGCVVYSQDKSSIKRFKPLNPLTKEFQEWFIDKYKIKLCDLYYPPYNFERTGCKGCPFAVNLQEELNIMSLYLPNERRQCESLWKYVYDEYRRINYRLEKDEQLSLF